MGIAKMNKLYLLAHRSEKGKVLDILQQLGVLEVNDLTAKDAENQAWADMVERDQAQEALQELEGRLADVRFALDFLNRYYPAKKGMLEALSGNKIAIGENELSGSVTGWAERSEDVYAILKKTDEKLMALRNEETRLQNMKLQLSSWAKLDLPLEEVKVTEAVRVELGSLPTTELSAVREKLEEEFPETFLEEVYHERDETFVVVVCHSDAGDTVQGILKQHNYNRHTFPDLRGTPAENLARITEELAQVSENRTAALAGAEEQAQYREVLQCYFDYLTLERDKKQLVASLAKTAEAFVLEGWIRENDVANVRQKLQAACVTVEIITRETAAVEAFPVALENKKVFAPFEFVTKLYGTPSPRGIDPTPLLAPFYIVFFGLCMTDAGYGVALALLAALGLLKIKGETVRRLLWVLFAGGISTIVFGWMLGGWLGLSILGAPLVFNPLVDPMPMLVFSLALGLFQIFFGMAVKFVKLAKEGELFAAFADVGLWVVLIIGLLLFAAPGMSGLARVLSLGGAAGLVLTQGRTQPTVVKKFFSGVLSLYNITGFLSDILSYSRLLALGLATGVIALAINTMAGLLQGHPVGYVFMVLFLIGGHVFNLVINTLGAYIHSSRLQYIEFYNRFYEGGGRAFVPFRQNTRHIDVQPNWQQYK